MSLPGQGSRNSAIWARILNEDGENTPKTDKISPVEGFQIEIRVRYADIDRLGVAYHSRYLEWFESARTELLREFWISYKELEGRGFHLPVVEARIRYFKPAFYDDLLSVRIPSWEIHGIRIEITYEVIREGEVLAVGKTVHAFVDSNGKATRPPRDFLENQIIGPIRRVRNAG